MIIVDFPRLVSAYINRIATGYRPISRRPWIGLTRGLSLETLLYNLRETILDKVPHLEDSTLLVKLLSISDLPEEEWNYKEDDSLDFYDNQMKFREFIRFVIFENLSCLNDPYCLREIDDHWQPQYVHCSPCDSHLDVISRVSLVIILSGNS